MNWTDIWTIVNYLRDLPGENRDKLRNNLICHGEADKRISEKMLDDLDDLKERIVWGDKKIVEIGYSFWVNQKKGEKKGTRAACISLIKYKMRDGEDYMEEAKEHLKYFEKYTSRSTIWRYKKDLKELGIEI